jgi:hypothetical protein
MRCPQCEFYINSCLGLCDARCLIGNDDVDSEQFKSLLTSSVNNLPAINVFLQRKASTMIEYLYNHEDANMKMMAVAVYYAKLSDHRKKYIMSLDEKHPARILLVQMDAGRRPNIKEIIIHATRGV